METLTLSCWVYGDNVGSSFPVEISRTKTVGDLKEAIKNERPVVFRDVDANSLALYNIPLPDDDERLEAELKKLTLDDKLKSSLGAHAKLYKLFTGSDLGNGETPFIIIKAPTVHLPVTLNCWVHGDDVRRIFSVEISRTKTVWNLKEAIKNKKPVGFRNVDARVLDLYRVSLAHDEYLDEALKGLTLAHEKPLDPLDPLSRVSPASLWNIFGADHLIATATAGPQTSGGTTSNKREYLEDPFEANKRIRYDLATLPIQTPSMIATPSNFQQHYEKKRKPYIRCGRPSENQSPFPLVLAHRIFAAFVSECETYKPSDEDLKFILKLSQRMCRFFKDEKDRRMEFLACMREYGISLMESNIEGTVYVTGGDARVGALPYLISEVKKDFGAAAADPYIQAAAYHLAALQSRFRADRDDRRALPCIHIFCNGPILGFAGSMLTEEFDVNVLGPILPLFYHRMDIDLQIRCAKMFGALKNAATALKEYYEHTMPQSFADTRFPWITRYDTITTPIETREYKYLRQMDGGSLLYICQHIHDEKRILVKFIQTYSKDAHLASAAKDGAPTLLGHRDVLSCGWSVVVMELLEGPDWVSGLKIVDRTEQRMVCDKVREHVLTLHQQGFVHGDIRYQNILVKRSDTENGHSLDVRLVDFDWAGETHKAKYPFLVNPDLGYGFERPSGVKGGGIITTEHDLAMVDLMYQYQEHEIRHIDISNLPYNQI